MKRLLTIAIVCIGIISCIPNGGVNPNGKIKAQLLRTTCASIVIQIQDSNYYYLGEDWSDIFRPSFAPYPHSVSVSNTCEFPSGAITEGDIFTFEINANPRQDCFICYLYDEPPKKQVAVKNVKR